MTRETSLRFLAEVRAMCRTGRQYHPDEERPVGRALAARLPRLVARIAADLKLGTRDGRVSP